ncbi:MAG: dTMP kinase [Candidatus Atribacteria bacterium]|nr:dTMP kinase [Candidatus Atribacteria bacterium]
MSDRGFFISFEGIEGSGKSAHSSRLYRFLEAEGYSCVLTQEPGGTPVGEKIRSLLLDPLTGDLDPLTETFLFQASRREHVERLIKPSLSLGKILICVRFIDSTLAYQGFGRKVDLQLLKNLNWMATGGVLPDLTLLLDVNPEQGLLRALSHTGEEELRFEQEFTRRKETLHSIRKGYLELARANSSRFIIIDSNREKEEVFRQIRDSVLSRLPKKGGKEE